MTKEQIGQSKISKAIYINGKWKVSVLYDANYYIMMIEGDTETTDINLSDLIYRELLEVEVVALPTPVTIVEKVDLEGDVPTEK